MKDKLQVTKKQLKAIANQLKAEVIAKNIYNYENVIYDTVVQYHNDGISAGNEIIAYSAGIYGNNGRIDKIINYDTHDYYFVCYY